MARKHQARELLQNGYSPAEIAVQMDISLSSVIQYLCVGVGEGALRLSDVYFSWTPPKRQLMQEACNQRDPDNNLLNQHGLTREELALFGSLRARGIFGGDMYEYISRIEIETHRFVRAQLILRYGEGEPGWWREGVPENIRITCVSNREADKDPCENAYAYTTLIHLVQIMEKNWSIFEPVLPAEYSGNKRQLGRDFHRLNGIRNTVMHPVKEQKLTEDDFEFVRSVWQMLPSKRN